MLLGLDINSIGGKPTAVTIGAIVTIKVSLKTLIFMKYQMTQDKLIQH